METIDETVPEQQKPALALCWDFGVGLCQDLGLDPAKVKTLQIISDPNEGVVLVQAVLYLTDEQGRLIRQRTARWKLTQREDGLSEPIKDFPTPNLLGTRVMRIGDSGSGPDVG